MCAMASRYIDTIRAPCFVEEDEKMSIVSLSDMEFGFSGNLSFFSNTSKTRGSHKAFSHFLAASSRSSEEHHFLESCFLCKKPIGENSDIFMYRGDTPFCSEECRQEQIDVDEGNEMKWKLSSSSSSRKEQQKGSTKKTQNCHARTGTVAAG